MTANEYRVAALAHSSTIRELRKEIEARDALIDKCRATIARALEEITRLKMQ
jgi:hypothetical protein